jgi:hypothetical protein
MKARLPYGHFNPSRSQRPYHHLDTNSVQEEIFAFITTGIAMGTKFCEKFEGRFL